jgi:hypothetical protein
VPGNVSTVDRMKRLLEIKSMIEEGKNENEILQATGMSRMAYYRNKKYIEELSIAQVDATEIADKRSELYLEAVEAAVEAREMFEKTKGISKNSNARMWFISWLETINLRMKLYGLDSIKVDSLTQINNNIQVIEPDKVNAVDGDRIAAIIKKAHEERRATG